MSQLVRTGKKSPTIRTKALAVVGGLGQKDWTGQAHAIWEYVRDQIRYVRDIRGVETVQTPDRTLIGGQGDCDDKATLVCALLESIGHPTRFLAVGFRSGDFSHVLAQTKIGKKWVSLETTEAVKFGWTPPNIKSAMVQYN